METPIPKSMPIAPILKYFTKNTDKVENMNSMFYGCSNLEELNVKNFDTV